MPGIKNDTNIVSSAMVPSPHINEKDLVEVSYMQVIAAPSAFQFTGVTRPGSRYTISFWIRADRETYIKMDEIEYPVTTEWVEVVHKFDALQEDFEIVFDETCNIWIYHAQLELGNMQTDWQLAVEDTDVHNIYYPGTVKVDGGKLYANSVTAGAIAALAIETRHLQAGAVNTDKLSVGTGGNLLTDYDTFAQLRDGDANSQNIYFSKSGNANVSLTSEIAPFQGSKCLKIQATGGDAYVYLGHVTNHYGCVPVVGDMYYYVSLYVKGTKANQQMQLYICEHTGQNSTVNNHVGDTFTLETTQWTRISKKYKASPQYPYISIRVDNEGGNGTALYVDAIMIEHCYEWTTEPSDFKQGGSVLIDGGNIIANSITADKIGVNQIQANHILGKSITSAKIDVSELSAIASNIGTITAGVLKSNNYAYSSGNYSSAGMEINLSGQTIRTQHFAVTNAGELYAKKGEIAGWEIGNGYMRSLRSGRYVGVGVEGTAWAFYAGGSAADGSNGVFRVGHDGSLVATSANITGTVSATNLSASNSGNIAGWLISSSKLYKTISQSGFNNKEFWLGDGSYNNMLSVMTMKDAVTNKVIFNVDHTGSVFSSNIYASNMYNDVNEGKIEIAIGFDLTRYYSVCGLFISNRTSYYPGSNPLNYGVWSYWTNDGISARWLVGIVGGQFRSNYVSDRRLKNDHGFIDRSNTIKLLQSVKIHEFDYKTDPKHTLAYGIIAQEYRDALIKNGIGYVNSLIINPLSEKDAGDLYYDLTIPEEEVEYGIDYAQLTPILWDGWQYHEEEIDALKLKITKLENQIETMKQYMENNEVM